MRFDLRLKGRTGDGKKCQADISVFANSKSQLEREAKEAASNAPWRCLDAADDWVPDGAKIIVEHVELLGRRGGKKRKPS